MKSIFHIGLWVYFMVGNSLLLFSGNDWEEKITILKNQEYTKPDEVLQKLAIIEKKLSPKDKKYYYLKTEIQQIFGNVYWFKGEYEKSIQSYRISHKYSVLAKNKSMQSKSLADIGYIYFDVGKNDSAVYYFIEAKKIADKLDDEMLQNTIKMYLADYYFENRKFDLALSDYKDLLIFFKKKNMSYDYAATLSNVANCYINLEKQDSAIGYLNRAIKHFDKLQMYSEKSENLMNLTVLMQQNGEGAEKTIPLLKQAQQYFLSIKSDSKYLASLLIEASLYKNYTKSREALAAYDQALVLAKKFKNLKNERDIYANRFDIYKRMNDYKMALENVENLNRVTKEIENTETLKMMEEVKAKFKTEKKEEQIKLLNKKRALQRQVIQKQKTVQFILIGGAVLLSALLLFVFKSFVNKRRDNRIISSQKHEIEEKHKEITDSITYAKRIQSAILPPLRLVSEYLTDSFILYKPKDIVAGDFYWFEALDDSICFAAADCTGHGVPGALVSIVCHNALNRSVKEFGLRKPGEILDKTREIILEEFEKSDNDVKDGMDISLCVFDKNKKTLWWSGAHNPLWILRNHEILEYKADKQPIGKYAEPKPFTSHEINLLENDRLYIFTDGFQDQFGGERGKKFKASQMKELLLRISDVPMEEQELKMDRVFEDWRGDLEQVDDVCIIGVCI